MTNPNRFTAFKVSITGSYEKWGYVHGLTQEQCIGEEYPPGKQHDTEKGLFVWSYALTECVINRK